jgi:hypothetical protein
MRSGGGKNKGSSFEREICVALSLWLTAGKREDCFWRSAMSGGRATVRKGAVRQAGDICAVAPEGHVLTDKLYMECKHLKNITLDSLIKGKGDLINIWKTTEIEAAKYGKIPTLVFRQNRWPTVMCTTDEGINFLQLNDIVLIQSRMLSFVKFDDFLKLPCTLVGG